MTADHDTESDLEDGERTPGETPFEPFLAADAPPIVDRLGRRTTDGIRRSEFTFRLRPQTDDDATTVYAALAEPDRPGPHPGVLVFHGGKQTAQVRKAEGWAKRGYVALAPTLPGIASPEEATHSRGPWTDLEYGSGRFVADPSPTESVVFDAVVAALQSFSLLDANEAVDSNQIGLAGISWGGYTATMLAGLLGERVAAVVSLFGAGYFDEGSTMGTALSELPEPERRRWLRTLDAGRHAARITAPFFQVCATNDAHFYPPSVQRTLDAMPHQERVNQVYAPNDDHDADVPGGFTGFDGEDWIAMAPRFFDYHLRDRGDPFPVAKTVEAVREGDGGLRVRFRATGPVPFVRQGVHYSDAAVDWPERTWLSASARPTVGERYEATVTATDLPDGVNRIDWFATVTDSRPVTVTSRIDRVDVAEAERTE